MEKKKTVHVIVTRKFTGTQTPTQAFLNILYRDYSKNSLRDGHAGGIMDSTIQHTPVASTGKGVNEIEATDSH